jgi:photosystem II stability/assembly factor-like uncharacterized protein
MNIKNIFTIGLFITSVLISFLIFNDQTVIKTEGKTNTDKISGAYDALNFFSLARTYPEDQIPGDAYYKAFEQMKTEQLSKSANNLGLNPWEAIGPHNTGGRTLALAFNPQNPNTMYAGSASGGLWRSYTGGIGVDAWQRIDTGFPVLGVSAIAIEPNDSNVIYIGTGEVYNYEAAGTGAAYRNTRGTYGIGILKTTDGGATWNKSLDWTYSEQHGVWAVKINPLNPNTVWAATTEGTFRSYDAGANWVQVHNVIMANDLVINPIDTNIIITGNGNFASDGFGIYRTSDGGNSWAHIEEGLPPFYEGKIQLDIYKADPNFVYASIGNGFSSSNGASWLCRSTDSGLTWSIRTTQDYSKWQGWFSHDVAVDQSNPDNLIVIGIEVYKSTNGGSNIIQKSSGGLVLGRPPIGGQEGSSDFTHSDAHDAKQHPTDHNIYYIATDGGIFRTTDFGETFESHNGRYQTVQFYNGTSSSQQDSLFFIGGLQDNSTVIYDGDLAWIRNIGGDGSWTAIDASNDNIIFASWQRLNILKSTNRGSSFGNSVTPPGNGPTAFIAPYRIFHLSSNIMYAGRDKIYKSTNGGNSWTATNNNIALDGNFAIAMDISYQLSNKVYVATAPSGVNRGHVFRTTRGGISWTDITGILPDRFPSDIAVDPNSDNIVYITFYGFGSGHVFKSTNSGNNWTDITGTLPDVPTVSVIVDPNNSNHVYVGNDLGVFISVDGGTTWENFNDGLPTAVIAMDLNITRSNDVIRVATHGNGVYERKLLSTIVTSINDNETIVQDFRLEQNYPNPFNPTTIIKYTVGKRQFVNIKVYDVLGNEVTSLVNEEKPAGTFEIRFDGSGLSSGTYFYKLNAGSFVETRKMILLK